MSLLPLPIQTLTWLKQAADSGQRDAQVLLHLCARADKRDNDVAVFVDSYSSTIAALCRRLEALERGASDRSIADTPAEDAPVDAAPVAAVLIKAESALADVAEGEIGRLCSATEKVTWAELRCTEALAAIRPVMRRYGIQTSELAPAPTPPPADPAERLVERVASAMGPSTQAAMDAGELPFGNAYAASREVADWLDTQGHQSGANAVRCELCR
jgi:hypothetical protein